MGSSVRSYQAAVVLLAAALLATLTVALTGGDPAEAVDGPVDVVYVATGRNYPDALTGANLAATTGAPMLTVNTSLPLPPDTVTALEALDPDRIVILGGTGAVSDEIAGALVAYARSGSVTRIKGEDRHGTAAEIAKALPDKVHDADLLDGLDATAFLRSNAAIDAETLDGHDSSDFLAADGTATDSNALGGVAADDLRVLNLGNWTYVQGTSTDVTALGGPTLDPDVDGGVGASFLLPPGHRTGDPIRVDLLVSENTFAACGVRLSTQGTSTRPDGSVTHFSNFYPVGTTEVAHTLQAPEGVNNHTLHLEVQQFEGEGYEPGTAFTFAVHRDADVAADNCDTDLTIRAAQVLY